MNELNSVNMNIGLTDYIAQRVGAIARSVPGFAGYGDRERRRDADRAVRLALAARVREARDRIGTAQRQLVGAGQMDAVVSLERILVRLGRLVDRLESTGINFGAWTTARALPDDVHAGLLDADHALSDGVDELIRSTLALDAGAADLAGRIATLDDLVAELNAKLDARLAAGGAGFTPVPTSPMPAPASASGLSTGMAPSPAATATDRSAGNAASSTAPRPSAGLPGSSWALATAAPGDRVMVEGSEHVVTVRTQWVRGDVALTLGAPDGGLRLWQDTSAERYFFEGQGLEVEGQGPTAAVPPPAEMDLDGEHFRLMWSDDGSAIESGPMGRGRLADPRWMYGGDAGGRLWVEHAALGPDTVTPRTWRGTPLAADEVRLL